MDIQKANNKMMGLNPNIPIITLIVNDLNILLKNRVC